APHATPDRRGAGPGRAPARAGSTAAPGGPWPPAYGATPYSWHAQPQLQRLIEILQKFPPLRRGEARPVDLVGMSPPQLAITDARLRTAVAAPSAGQPPGGSSAKQVCNCGGNARITSEITVGRIYEIGVCAVQCGALGRNGPVSVPGDRVHEAIPLPGCTRDGLLPDARNGSETLGRCGGVQPGDLANHRVGSAQSLDRRVGAKVGRAEQHHALDMSCSGQGEREATHEPSHAVRYDRHASRAVLSQPVGEQCTRLLDAEAPVIVMECHAESRDPQAQPLLQMRVEQHPEGDDGPTGIQTQQTQAAHL